MKTRMKAIEDLVTSLNCHCEQIYHTEIRKIKGDYRATKRLRIDILSKKGKFIISLPDSYDTKSQQEFIEESLTEVRFVDLYNEIKNKCTGEDDKLKEYNQIINNE